MAEAPTPSGPDLFIEKFEEVGALLADHLPSLSSLNPEQLIALLDVQIAAGVNAVRAKLEEKFGAFIARFLSGVLAAILLVMTKSTEALGLTLGLLGAFKKEGEVGAYELKQPLPLDPQTLVSLLFKKTIPEGLFTLEMNRNGISTDRAIRFALASRAIPSPAEIMAALRLGVESVGTLDERMGNLGYNQADTAMLFKLVRTLMDPELQNSLLNRKFISEQDYNKRLEELGFNAEDRKHHKELSQILPSVQDMVTMVVREAFEEDQIALLTLGAELPPVFIDSMKLQGISEEWAKRYWYAHWQQPSVGQGYDMFHRRIITADEMKALFKTIEIAPFWRDKLLALSYDPLTRVDIRRMYGLGILTEEEVYNAYLDTGYSPENARRLTDFTVSDTIEGSLGIVRAALLTLFRRGLITEEQIRHFLATLKWSQVRIDNVVEQEKFLAEVEITQNELRAIREQFMKGVINEAEMLIALTALALPFAAIADYAHLWLLQKKARVSRITLKDLKAALKEKIITEEEFLGELAERGFRPKDAQIILKLQVAITSEEAPIPAGPELVMIPSTAPQVLPPITGDIL